ncbi:MAG: hypothetical protein M1813_007076 [Trichoglossum hirsutum]|nr:MAG: hypothetical protein M1813_007076 [Trichoglossum hirsutum]
MSASVLVWLGKEGDAKYAMEFLYFLDHQPKLGRRLQDEKFKHHFLTLLSHGFSTERSISFDNLLSRDYWKRIWILQEVALGKDVMLCAGLHTVSFSTIVALYRFLGYVPSLYSISAVDHNNSVIGQLTEIHRQLVDDAAPTLFNALLLGRQRFASNDHDYIYGLLGIANMENVSLTPDYGKSLFSANREAFQCIIQQEQNLDVLSACRELDPYENYPSEPEQDGSTSSTVVDNTGWPSWLPNWSRKTKATFIGIRSILLTDKGRKYYRAAGSSEPSVHFLEDPYLFVVKGTSFDIVDYISPNTWSDSADKNISLLEGVVQEDGPYDDAEAQRNALEKTATLGQEFSADEHSSDYAQADFLHELMCRGHYTRFFATRKGYIGRGPVSMQKGDQVCILLGAKVPFVLHHNHTTKRYSLLGESCE